MTYKSERKIPCLEKSGHLVILLMPFVDGGNLNADSIDVEAENGVMVEAEPVRPKRKLIATLQVSLRG